MVRKAEKQNLEILANLAVQQNHLFRKDIIKECREVVYRDTPLHFFCQVSERDCRWQVRQVSYGTSSAEAAGSQIDFRAARFASISLNTTRSAARSVSSSVDRHSDNWQEIVER